jgi:hypothetical protein
LTRVTYSSTAVLVFLGLLLSTACGPAAGTMSGPPSPAPTSTVTMSPSATLVLTATPTATTAHETPTVVPLNGEGLLAWDVAADGAVFVLDATHRLYQLSPDDLLPLAQSSPLFESSEEAPASLLADQSYVFVGSATVSETLVLDRSDLSPVTTLEGFGPLALEPGQRLFMIPLGVEEKWPWGNFEIWAYDLMDLRKPPDRVRYTGASFDELVVDPPSRRIYALVSNIGASPPHQGQRYDVYSLDTLTRTVSFDWERGILTPPVINPRTGEIMGSRIGLNWTRRFLIVDQQGQEVRDLPSVDGQPVMDVAGEWIYLLRQRGLWVLREQDLSLQSVLPFTGPPPADLALSPDGETLYLFGNGWLTALSTMDLRSQGIAPVTPLPTAWFASKDWPDYVEPRVYPSPQIDEDRTVFVQLVSGMKNVLETYYTTDGGDSWYLLTALVDPGLAGAGFLSLSPTFAQDKTMTAYCGSTLLRSTDGGVRWEAWQPRIAFVSERDGNREIYTMTLDGQDARRLTNSPAAEENPAWSPAWTRLAFQSNHNGNWDIYTVRADCDPSGSQGEKDCGLRQLTDDPADDVLPAWSPDGRSIAFVSMRDGNPEIYVMDNGGQNQRRLTFNPSGDWRPAWLPDSTHLVFVTARNGNNDIYQLAVPSSDAGPLTSEPELTPVIVSPADDRDPAVRLDAKVLFLSDRDGFLRTYTALIGDKYSSPRAFNDSDQPEAHPAGLPDDPYTTTSILVSAERDGQTDIYRVVLSEYRPVAPSPAFDGQPAAEPTGWEPDSATSLAWIQEH